MDKFSSNVIEKCIEFGSQEFIMRFIDEINEKERIVDVIKNSFGNFVIQKALKMANSFNLFKLVNSIKMNLEKIQEKRVVSKWRSIIKPYESKLKYFENLSNQSELNDRDIVNGYPRMNFVGLVEKQLM